MLRLIVAIASLALCPLAGAQATTLADVKAGDGVQLTAQELKQLMPGAKLVSRTQAGSTRRWENKPDGTFSASTDGRDFDEASAVEHRLGAEPHGIVGALFPLVAGIGF